MNNSLTSDYSNYNKSHTRSLIPRGEFELGTTASCNRQTLSLKIQNYSRTQDYEELNTNNRFQKLLKNRLTETTWKKAIQHDTKSYP